MDNNNSCSNFNEETFIDTLNDINDNITKGEFQDSLKALGSDECPLIGGSRRKRKSRTRSFKGGKIPIKNIIKTLLYVLIAALVSLGMNSPNLQTVKDGLMMIYNGQCNTLTNRIWSWVGIENPVCALYNNLLFKIIPNALLGNAEAVTKLVGMFSIGFGGPVLVIKQIDSIGTLIEDAVNNTLQIENTNTNANANINQNNDSLIPADFSNELTRRGGKRRRKTRKIRRRRY
jgi:hypothetical protein